MTPGHLMSTLPCADDDANFDELRQDRSSPLAIGLIAGQLADAL